MNKSITKNVVPNTEGTHQGFRTPYRTPSSLSPNRRCRHDHELEQMNFKIVFAMREYSYHGCPIPLPLDLENFAGTLFQTWG